MRYFVKATLKNGATVEFMVKANSISNGVKKANICMHKLYNMGSVSWVSDLWVGTTKGIHCHDYIVNHHMVCGLSHDDTPHGTCLVIPTSKDGKKYDYDKMYREYLDK